MTTARQDLPPGVWACDHCSDPVVIRPLRDSRRWPFERAMFAPEDLAESLRWVPMQSGYGIVMVPASDISPYKLAQVRWYAARHTCAQWLMAHRRERDDHVVSLADALADALGVGPAN